MYTASYMVGSTGIRYKAENGYQHEMKWLPKIKKSRGLNPEVIRERADRVFQLLPQRMKHLVIVNGNLSDFEMIQACVKVAEKYADDIMVISPLLARITYALKDVAQLRSPPSNESILIVSINEAFCDFVMLERNRNFELNIIHREIYEKRNKSSEEFPRIYGNYFPYATIILVEDGFAQFVDEIRRDFSPKNLFVRFYKRWDHMLFNGALMRAPNVNDREFDQRYWIPNFSMGIEISIAESGTYVILPEATKIPCKFYGFNGTPQPYTLFFSPEYYQIYDGLTIEQKIATRKPVWLTGTCEQEIGYFDDRGVPYLIPSATERPSDNISKPFQQSIKSLPTTAAPRISIIFEKQFFSAEIYQNGLTRKVTDSAGNEWTPLYLSMAAEIPEIGEKAKSDYQQFPKHVIYDVFKVIGKPLKEIQINPKWGFELIESNGIVYFQIETPSGPRLFPQELVVSAFLKFIKLRVQSNMGAESVIDKIDISTNFRLLKSQQEIFEKAAAKNNLKILTFVVTEID